MFVEVSSCFVPCEGVVGKHQARGLEGTVRPRTFRPINIVFFPTAFLVVEFVFFLEKKSPDPVRYNTAPPPHQQVYNTNTFSSKNISSGRPLCRVQIVTTTFVVHDRGPHLQYSGPRRAPKPFEQFFQKRNHSPQREEFAREVGSVVREVCGPPSLLRSAIMGMLISKLFDKLSAKKDCRILMVGRTSAAL